MPDESKYEIPPEVYQWWASNPSLRDTFSGVPRGDPRHPATYVSIIDLYNKIHHTNFRNIRAEFTTAPEDNYRKLNIALLVDGLGLSGGLKAAFKIANEFIRRGHEVTIYHSGHKWEYDCKANFKTCNNENDIDKQHDAYVAMWWETAPMLDRLHVEPSKKFYFIQHWEAKWAGNYNQVQATYSLPLFRISVSDWVAKGTNSQIVIHPPFYYDGFRPAEVKNLDVMFLRQDVWWKNPNFGDKVINELMSAGLKVASVYHVTDSTLKDIYSRSKIFIFTSQMEGMPAPPLEAMLSGCAVVTTDCGGIRDYANPDSVIYVGDDRQMVGAVKSLLADKDRLDRLARKGMNDALRFIKDIDENSIDKFEFLFRGGWERFREDCARGERLYPEWTGQDVYNEHFIRYEFAKSYCVNKRVLDVGCGSGYGSNLLGTVALSVVGIEKSELPFNYARLKWNRFNVSFVNKDFLEYASSFGFDTIAAFESIEHIKGPEMFLEKCYELLEPDGTLIISIPYDSLNRSQFHVESFSIERILKLFEGKFEVLHKYYQHIRDNEIMETYIDEKELVSWIFVCRRMNGI